MFFLFLGVGLVLLGGILAHFSGRRLALAVGAGGVVTGTLVALVASFMALLSGRSEGLRLSWNVPFGAFHIEVDALSAFLIGFFVLASAETGSLDFERLGAAGDPWRAGILFLLALVGFGTKAGLMPFHIWLPEAHPAAPSHVSALMSAVMIKTGIYGLLRALRFLGPIPAWCGWVLAGLGLLSGVLGVLFAIAQHDIKRLLAYHSVENIGIIALGLGLGLVGLSHGFVSLAVLGFAGGLLHVVNHALFKGLLFLGAGAVLHASGTREMDRLGGLLKLMPWTGAMFLVGCVAISGLPPLNGFVSEFLIYLGAFRGSLAAGISPGVSAPAVLAILGLAVIGALATACFTKAFGVVFLGEPRSEEARHGHDPGLGMLLPMLLLAAGCALMASLPAAYLGLLAPVVVGVCGLPGEAVRESLESAREPLLIVALLGAGFLGAMVFLAATRRVLFRKRPVKETVTWDCGYARPSARMQYTSSSFADTLIEFFGLIVLSVVVGVVESSMARLRLVRVPQMLIGAGALSALALFLAMARS
ncbi:MAG: NADH-quinone oxidoreductase subunit H [Planctomycetes bacterium]|nr:NADH-quinone oxidoreductase subunit H [Planctomycetota bacterium]